MSTKKALNQTKEASATAKFARKSVKVADAIHETLKASGVVKQHPEYPTRPAMQSSVGEWEKAANQLGDLQQKLGTERSDLAAAEASLGVTVADWKRATATVIAIINALAGGSEKALKEWGFEVETRGAPPPETSPPENLRATFSRRDLTLTLKWKAVRGHRGYLLQIGDASSPIVWGPTTEVAESLHRPAGLTPGQHISVRVAVLRKAGLSGWSDILALTVR